MLAPTLIPALMTVATLLLGGCGGLYGPRAAPIYDSNPIRARHSVLNSTSTPMPRMQPRPVYQSTLPPSPLNTPQPINNTINTVNRSIPSVNTVADMPFVTPPTPATTERPTRVTSVVSSSGYPSKETNIAEADGTMPSAVASNSNTALPNRPRVDAQPQPDASQQANQQLTKAEATPPQAVASTTKSAPKSLTPTQLLLKEANDAVKNNNLPKAASALERAHRINPGNATILYDIAQVRYAQGKYAQAESFASKAATHASNSPTLAKKIWRLLAKARKASGNASGAASALKKAASL